MVEIGTTLSAEVAAFAAAYTNVILIPGPSFVVVCEAGLTATRREACLVAAGVACGAGALATAILQAAPFLQASPDVMIAVRLGCAFILLSMGFRILCRSLRRGGKVRRQVSAAVAGARFSTGFVAAVTNPVSLASFTTAALTVGSARHGVDCLAVSFTVFLMAAGWFNTLAIVSSQSFLTTHYGRVTKALGSIMGCVLIVKALAFLIPTF